MNHEDFKKYIAGLTGKEELGLLDALYDEAYIGVSSDGRVAYSYDRMVEIVMLNKFMDYEEAIGFVDFVTIRELKKMGPDSPVVIYDDPDFMRGTREASARAEGDD